ncbi:MAG: hypothetical protein ACOYNS_07435 [Bacteroidota bacterium]
MRNSSVKIQVGLTAADAAWESILRQIGIASKSISIHEEFDSEYSVLIVNSRIEPAMRTKIDEFMDHSGVVLYTTKADDDIRSYIKERRDIRSLPPRRTENYEYFGILDIYSSVAYFSNGDLVLSEQSGNGIKYFLGISIDDFFINETIRRNFYTPSERKPNEVVSLRSKGTLRQLIFSLLTKMHHQQSLPFIHQWYYPGSERTIFTFRIDSDKGTKEQVEEIRSLSERYSVPTTWFLDVKSHEQWLPFFQTFGDQEIGLHCYEHILFQDKERNKENFSKALSLLKQEGLEPKGITAPTGGWQEGYAEAIRELGFTYSSEFSYDYDDLPSFPLLNGKTFPIPQLPIHPVCIGTMRRVRMNEEKMVQHFRSLIDLNLQLNEPICLYQHPTHGHNGVFEQVFQYIDSLSIAKLSYSDYAAWWKHRDENCGPVQLNNGTVEAVNDTGNVRHRIILPGGHETITAVNEVTRIDELPFTAVERNIEFPEDIMQARAFDIRHSIQNALDWWIKTTE